MYHKFTVSNAKAAILFFPVWAAVLLGSPVLIVWELMHFRFAAAARVIPESLAFVLVSIGSVPFLIYKLYRGEITED